MSLDEVPEFVRVHGEILSNLRSSSQGHNSTYGVARNQMSVVSVVFGKGLLEDGSPERLVRLGSVGKYSHILTVAKLLKGQVVVDNDRCLDAHVVEMDGIGILGAETSDR